MGLCASGLRQEPTSPGKLGDRAVTFDVVVAFPHTSLCAPMMLRVRPHETVASIRKRVQAEMHRRALYGESHVSVVDCKGMTIDHYTLEPASLDDNKSLVEADAFKLGQYIWFEILIKNRKTREAPHVPFNGSQSNSANHEETNSCFRSTDRHSLSSCSMQGQQPPKSTATLKQ